MEEEEEEEGEVKVEGDESEDEEHRDPLHPNYPIDPRNDTLDV